MNLRFGQNVAENYFNLRFSHHGLFSFSGVNLFEIIANLKNKQVTFI